MSKKSTKALASATLMSLVLTTALSAGPVKAAQGQVTRVSGQTRYATAAKVATTNWTTSDDVVLVSGEGYADAVSASALAKKLNAPILLTTGNTLSSDAENALTTLKPKNVYVIGGNASISQSIRDGLKSKYTLKELGGSNRYLTNVAVAKELVSLGVSASDVMVVGGQGFADALSVAPVAAAKGQILLLANNDKSASQAAIDFVKDNKSNATIVGTTNVISDTIKDAFGTTAKRVDGGSSRFDTNLKVLNAFKSDLKADKLYVANASAATPDNLYADALVASALAGKYTAPLVLVDKDGTDATNSAVAYIKGENAKDIEVIGGTGVVPDSIISEISGQTTNPTDYDVNSISANGLRQIKVVFNNEVDSDTAEDVNNYKVDGSSLTQNVDNATLQDDNKTVLLTLATKRNQGDNVEVKVKKGVLSADKSTTVPEFTQTVSFNDTTAPTLDSVEARGNKKLTVKFSEPVNLGATISSAASKFKINDQSLSSFGLDTNTSEVKNSVKVNGNLWSNEVDFYFNSALKTGNNTLKVDTGDSSTLEDAAGFPIQETTQDFNIDTLTTKPQITGITANDDGKVYINFDRAMDPKTTVGDVTNPANASILNNYQINDGKVNISKAELKKDDTQIKLSVSGLNKGSNKLYVKDNVKDAYGNKVDDDTYKSFDLSEDDTKPAVTSVTTLSDTTIRVRFNKNVDATYAKNISNYKLQDNGGSDITNRLTTPIIAGDTSSNSADVFDIKLGKDLSGNQYKFSDSKYTITIKNIIDTASTPNKMDDYTTTFDGSSDVSPEALKAYAIKDTSDANNYRKVVVTFNKEMDASTLTDKSSYKFQNASGDTKTLPSDVDLTPGSDNKSVTIKFPDAYGTKLAGKSDDNTVSKIAVIGVKDTNGTALDVSSTLEVENPPATGTTVDDTSFKVYYEDNSDDLKVSLKFNTAIDNFDASDFLLAGQAPSSGYKDGDRVILQFNDGSDALKAVKAKGVDAQLTTVPDKTLATTDITGATIKSITAADKIIPYYYDAAPKTIADDTTNGWAAGIVGNTDATKGTVDKLKIGTTDQAYVDITFDTPIDPNSGVTTDAFTFSVGGGNIKADNIAISGNTVRFLFNTKDEDGNDVKFNNNPVASYFDTVGTDKIGVIAQPSVSIRTLKDQNDEHASYVPSSDDIKLRTITVGTIGAVKGN
ncbi:cell wall-binding repeat-containing protein [Clostridium sp. 001]|uniref:cell wall-binding repeat-containing protein n=1 Tax=Clostridium sp. 001 TaxID=1970093 RepID=UPI001C2C5CBF|nr:cell wall-binding repeat-containing protein [Clostridium sp. 001]QXE19721.1 hypothetical protein B5S50_13280 [Clostridium sp. 001]